jgi:hypothetical protein
MRLYQAQQPLICLILAMIQLMICSVLSDNIQSKILSSVEQSPFFSIQIDEGTDFSNLTTLMIYIRYLNESGHIDSKFECK